MPVAYSRSFGRILAIQNVSPSQEVGLLIGPIRRAAMEGDESRH